MYDLLKGLRVVEGAAFIAGPSCSLYLAQMGAEVIRFDSIGGGPDFHRWPLGKSGLSLYWEGLNRGKKSIAINLGKPEGKELAIAIATASGVNAGLFVTNYPVDGFLSYERLKAARNDIICVRIMGWADGAPAVDYTVNAASGVPFMTGPSDHYAPVNHVLPAWDLLSGAYAAFMLVSAERKRRITGVGSDIRIPLSDIAAASLSHMGQLAEVLTEGRDRPRLGNALYGAFGRDFTTGDGRRVMVVAITPRQWKGLIATLDVATAISALETELKVSFATDEGARFIHRHRLFPIFETAFATRELSMLADAMDAEGVTWAPYQTLHQAASQDPRLFTQNPIFENTSNPSGEHYPAAGSAATLAGNVRGQVQRSPRLGEHTDEVLATVLGLGQAQIARLHDSGVVASPESLP